jgi:hypothetical protein
MITSIYLGLRKCMQPRDFKKTGHISKALLALFAIYIWMTRKILNHSAMICCLLKLNINCHFCPCHYQVLKEYTSACIF